MESVLEKPRTAGRQPRTPRAPMLNCPHCHSRAYCRTSQALSPLYREITYACDNVECGHTFVAGLEIIRTLSPAARPNPAVNLPIAPPRARSKHANDNQEPVEQPPATNDPVHVETG